MKTVLKAVGVAALLTTGTHTFAQKDPTIRIAMLLPLSGSFAGQGQNYLKTWQFAAERLGGAGGGAPKVEIVGFDNKGSPQDTLNVFKAATDQGFRYVMQANGSGAALALADAVAKFNQRNPGKEVLNLNSDAQDPSLTNEKCSFWYFRLDPDTTMKMEALTSFMKDQPKVRNVFLINQDYAHGQQVSRYFKETIAKKRPDVKIVGDDLHPIGLVKDFSPYAAKIKQSGADAIVTGNWGSDLTLLVKALNDSGLKLPMYTYYANVTGTPTALADSGDQEIFVVTYAHANHDGAVGSLAADFKKKFNDDFYNLQAYNGMKLLVTAVEKAGSAEPEKVALAMEGLSIKSFAGDITVRKTDHQLQQPMFITAWQKVGGKYTNSVENTGYTFVPVKQLDASVVSTPTSCQMKRPS